MRRTFFGNLLSFILVGTMSQVAHGAGAADELQRLYATAKGEKQVNLWGANAEDLNWIKDSFAKEYPGISIRIFTDLNIVARAIAESTAGRNEADVIWNSEALLLPLVERGILAKPKWSTLGVAEENVGAKGHMAYTGSVAYVFAFRTDSKSKITMPDRWEDIDGSQFRGRVAAGPILMGRLIAALGAAGNEDHMLEFSARLKKSANILWTNDLLEQALTTGERQYVAAIPYYFVDRWKAKGLPIDYVFPNPVFITQFGSVVSKTAPHPAAASLLAAWLGGESGRRARRAALQAVDLRANSLDPQALQLRKSGRQLIIDNDELRRRRNALIPKVDRILAGY